MADHDPSPQRNVETLANVLRPDFPNIAWVLDQETGGIADPTNFIQIGTYYS